jgi:pimeloyl-ACP methyl ester carboxylesterase
MFSSRGVMLVVIGVLITVVRGEITNCQVGSYDAPVVNGYLPRPLSNGDTINVYYWCVGVLENAERQVWLLQGGPGGSSYLLHGDLVVLYTLDPNGYYCTSDYRGVGCSDQLLCSNQTQDGCNFPNTGCIQEIQLRYNFSDFYTGEAAHDVIALIEMNQITNPSAEVIIYGVSYGTFWVQRIMQLSNNIADKWIFDGVVLQPWFQNGGWQYGIIEITEALKRFFDDCFNDVICQLHFSEEKYYDWYNVMISNSEMKELFNDKIYELFSNPNTPSTPNNFIELINIINQFLTAYSTGQLTYKRSVPICDSDYIVYLIVKANELYADYLSNSEFSFLLSRLPYSSIGNDIGSTTPWIKETIRDYSPIVTSGSVLVLGGQYDMQTVYNNSVQLHEYFLSNGVDSTLLEGNNWGHGVFRFNSSIDQLCGYHILTRFILGYQLQPECLSYSSYINFTTATYFVPPTTTPTPSSTSSNGTIIYFLTPSSSGALIAVSVLLALTWAGILGFVGYVVYRRYFQPYPKVQIDAVNLVERIEAL